MEASIARRESLAERYERLSSGPRLRVLSELVDSISATGRVNDGDFNALAMLVVDAILDGDEHTLDRSLVNLQLLLGQTHEEAARGRLLGLLDVISWGLDRSLSFFFIHAFEQSSHAHGLLRLIAEKPGSSNLAIADELGISESEVSRVGRQLVQAGAATKRRLGRRNHWEITPRGVHALELLEGGGISRYQRPHYQLSS